MVKLEKPAAIRRLDEIIELADAVMVARGDLGVEMPPEDVPIVQKQVVHACRLAGKPVVVATQMLESMIQAPTPTRAEASDVATAVYDGADAVMLSAETAAGRYPVEAAAMMNRIACRVQEDPLYRSLLQGTRTELEHTAPDAISAAACQVAAMVGAAAIVSYLGRPLRRDYLPRTLRARARNSRAISIVIEFQTRNAAEHGSRACCDRRCLACASALPPYWPIRIDASSLVCGLSIP
jgi:pyruvate kinase